MVETGNNSYAELTFSLYGADGLDGRVNNADFSYVAETYDPQGNVVQPVALYPIGGYGTPGVGNGPVRVTASTAYDAFGGSYGHTADGGGNMPAAYEPAGFGGQFGYYHDYTGRYLLGHRFYDSFTGRFVTRDPIGYKGGINLYGFTGNNPVNESDPSGFQPGPGPYTGPGIDWKAVGDRFSDAASALANSLQHFDNWYRTVPANSCGCITDGNSFYKRAAAPGNTSQGMSMMAGKGGQVPTGLRDASPGLEELFSGGSVRGRSIIGIRQTLLKNGFKMSKTKGFGYLFKYPAKKQGFFEQVRIMSRKGTWDIRVQNGQGGNLDEFGNQADPNLTHGINVLSK